MADPIDIDPTRDDTFAAEGGATRGGDDDTQDTEEPSSIEGTPSGRIMAAREVEQDFPYMDRNTVNNNNN